MGKTKCLLIYRIVGLILSLFFSFHAVGFEILRPELAYSSPGDRNFLGMNFPMIGRKWPYRKGSVWVNLASSRNYIVYPEFGKQTGLPPLSLSLDYSIDSHWAIGGYAGFFRSTYTDTFGNEPYQSKIESYFGGARLTFHFADIFNRTFGEVVNIRKWDFYSTAWVGWYSFRWQVGEKYLNEQDFSEGTFASMGMVVGVRWHPVPRLGIFAEFGKGPVGLLGFGLSGKIVK